MPHDANGNLLKPGDLVNIPGTVLSVRPGDYCTCEVQLDYPMPPYTTKTTVSAINAAQVVKRVGGKIYACECRASGADDLPDYCSEHPESSEPKQIL
jgi:hypothetical protein